MKKQGKTKGLAMLDEIISKKWAEILSQPQALNFAGSFMGADRRVFALYMTQVYYYTFHTARNQALVAVNQCNKDIKYMQFCLEHALEETGHELMALHDLRSIGVPIDDPDKDMPPAFPQTELLIAYLYWISSNGSPLQRLGYSYWAERSYDIIGSFVETLSDKMDLEKKQMTFYYSHATIDDKHAKDVEKILLYSCKTDDDWKQVAKAAAMTIDLTHNIINQVLIEYEKLVSAKPSDFEVLNCLKPIGSIKTEA